MGENGPVLWWCGSDGGLEEVRAFGRSHAHRTAVDWNN